MEDGFYPTMDYVENSDRSIDIVFELSSDKNEWKEYELLYATTRDENSYIIL